MKLWWGQGISELGSQVSLLALPTVAILTLSATPFQVGLLEALQFLAFPVLGLIAGVYADRIRRRPIMIICDLLRMVALGSVPLAYVLGQLSMEQLYVVALLVGVGTVFFDVAYQSYLPAIISRSDLVEGNSKLQVTGSVAQMVGPALAGFLIQLVGAARAVALDATSFLVSVLSLWWIRRPEPAPKPSSEAGRSGFFSEMLEGIRFVLGNPTISRIAGSTATSNLGGNMVAAVYLIFAYRFLHLTPGVIGVVFAAGAVGGLLGALSASWITTRIGVGPTRPVRVRDPAADRLALRRQLGQPRVQHHAGQPAPGHHPRPGAGPHERHRAHDHLGHHPDRRIHRRHHRHGLWRAARDLRRHSRQPAVRGLDPVRAHPPARPARAGRRRVKA